MPTLCPYEQQNLNESEDRRTAAAPRPTTRVPAVVGGAGGVDVGQVLSATSRYATTARICVGSPTPTPGERASARIGLTGSVGSPTPARTE